MKEWNSEKYINSRLKKRKLKRIKKEANEFSLDKLKEFCNYDGLCCLSQTLSDEFGYAFCYGDKYGKEYCPLTHILNKFNTENHLTNNQK